MVESPRVQIHILVVEDHCDTATVLHLILTRRGYEVTIARSADSARQLALHLQFDVAISNIILPDGSGLDLVKELKASQPMKAIALSCLAMDADRCRSLAEGFDRHINKPFQAEELLATIEELTIEIPE